MITQYHCANSYHIRHVNVSERRKEKKLTFKDALHLKIVIFFFNVPLPPSRLSLRPCVNMLCYMSLDNTCM